MQVQNAEWLLPSWGQRGGEAFVPVRSEKGSEAEASPACLSPGPRPSATGVGRVRVAFQRAWAVRVSGYWRHRRVINPELLLFFAVLES